MSVKSFVSKHKKSVKVIAAVIAFAMIAGLLVFANGLLGNPISYCIAKSKAKKYVAENYADMGYILESVNYSFKNGDYIAHIEKPDSEDRHFVLGIGFDGRLGSDNYENCVLNGGNTQTRLDMRYREFIHSVTESSAYPYSSQSAGGTLVFEGYGDYDFAVSKSILVPDGLYDIAELGEKGGLLYISVDTSQTTPENAAEILLEINALMKQGGVTFYAIDLTLMDRTLAPADRVDYNLKNFHRSDIYEDGLVERVVNNHQKTEQAWQNDNRKEIGF